MNYNYQQWRKECNQYQKNKTEARCSNQRKQLTLMNNQIKNYKELLKECQYMILAYSINHDTFTKEKVRDIVTQIDNAIGEKK